MIVIIYANVILCAVFLGSARGNSVEHLDNDTTKPQCNQSAGPAITKSAYINWPFSISCSIFSEHFYNYYDYETSEINNVECQIWDSDNDLMLVNQSITADDYSTSNYATYDPIATDNTPIHYEVIVVHKYEDKESSCTSQSIKLNITNLPEQTCQEASNALVLNREGDLGSRKKWPCKIFENEMPYVPLSDHPERDNITVQWLKDCKPLKSGTASMDGTSLQLDQVQYDHAGMYTCAVHRNGQTRYLAGTNFCVRGPTERSREPTLKCDSIIVRAKENAPATVRCVGTIGVGNIRRHYYSVLWNKEGESSNTCINQMKQERISREEGSPQCTTTYQDQPCYAAPPPLENRKAIPAQVFIQLTIPKLHHSNVGKYVVSFAAVEYRTTNYINTTVTIEIGNEASEERNIIIAGVCLGVAAILVVTLIAVLICRRNGYMCYESENKRKLKLSKCDTITDEFEMAPNSESEETKPV